jgi:hypothetical protein
MRSNMDAPLSNGRRPTPPSHAILFFAALALVALASAEAAAQGDSQAQRSDEPAAAPPMRYVPDDVRRQLDAEARDVKARTKLGLQLAEDRLARATTALDADRFEEATNELGVYEAIVADMIHFVQASGRTGNKLRDTFKRIELALRAHVPRIETLRRGMPAAHAVYAKETIEFVRTQRDQALSSFYDDTVIPEPARPAVNAAGVRAGSALHPVPDGEKKPERH